MFDHLFDSAEKPKDHCHSKDNFLFAPQFQESFFGGNAPLRLSRSENVSGGNQPSSVEPVSPTKPEKHQGFVDVFVNSMLYSAFQAPLTGLEQIGNKVGFIPDSWVNHHLIENPGHYKFMSPQYWAATIGGGIGTVLPFVIASRGADAGIARAAKGGSSTISGFARVLESQTNPIANLAFKGAIYEGLLHPVNDKNNFWQERFNNVAAGAVSMAALGAFGEGLNPASRAIFGQDISSLSSANAVGLRMGVMGVGGAVSGDLNYAINQMLSGKKIHGNDLVENALQGATFASAAAELRQLNTKYLKTTTSDSSSSHLDVNTGESSQTASEKAKFSGFFDENKLPEEFRKPTISKDGKAYALVSDDARAQVRLYKEIEPVRAGASANPSTPDNGRRDSPLDPRDIAFNELLLEKNLNVGSKNYVVAKEELPNLLTQAKSFNVDGKNYLTTESGKVFTLKTLPSGHVEIKEVPNVLAVVADAAQTPWSVPTGDSTQTPWSVPTGDSDDQSSKNQKPNA